MAIRLLLLLQQGCDYMSCIHIHTHAKVYVCVYSTHLLTRLAPNSPLVFCEHVPIMRLLLLFASTMTTTLLSFVAYLSFVRTLAAIFVYVCIITCIYLALTVYLMPLNAYSNTHARARIHFITFDSRIQHCIYCLLCVFVLSLVGCCLALAITRRKYIYIFFGHK